MEDVCNVQCAMFNVYPPKRMWGAPEVSNVTEYRNDLFLM